MKIMHIAQKWHRSAILFLQNSTISHVTKIKGAKKAKTVANFAPFITFKGNELNIHLHCHLSCRTITTL